MPSSWVLVDLLTKKIKLRRIKSTVFLYRYITGKDPDFYRTVGSGSVPYQIDKQDPDPYQNGLNPQHCSNLI